MGQAYKEYTWSLIAKKLNGEATSEELRELEDILRSNPELHYPVQTVSDLWISSTIQDETEAEAAFNRHLERVERLRIDFFTTSSTDISNSNAEIVNGNTEIVNGNTEVGNGFTEIVNSNADIGNGNNHGEEGRTRVEKASVRKFRLSWIMAACFSGLILLSAAWWQKSRHVGEKSIATTAVDVSLISGNEIYTGTGSRTHVALPDGSIVWLNAGSRIKYEKGFGINDREVSLTGEAFFDVAPNASKPFVIHTSRIDIRVLGTSFNVKSYPTDKTTETTLIKGSIEVSIRNRSEGEGKIIMKPNEKLIVSNEDSMSRQVFNHDRRASVPRGLVTIGNPTYEPNTGSIVETSWIDNKLIFQDEEFGALAKLMERWYGVNIHFDNSRLQTLRFTGIFEKETIGQALDALKMTADFSYSVEGTQITIHDK